MTGVQTCALPISHMIFRVADPEKLIAVLQANGIQPIAGQDLGIR